MSYHSPSLRHDAHLGQGHGALVAFVQFCLREWDPDPASQSRIAARLPDGFGDARSRSTLDVLNDLMELRLHHGRRACDFEQRRLQDRMFVQLVGAAALGPCCEARVWAGHVVKGGKVDEMITLAREFAGRMLALPQMPVVASHIAPRCPHMW